MKIKDNIIAILSQAEIKDKCLFLHQKLERKDYLDSNNILESIGGKWNKKLKCHLFDQDPENILSEIINTGEFECRKTKKQLLNYFPTPKSLVKKLVGLAEIKLNDLVLETSAGQGAILEELVKVSKFVHFVEIDQENYNSCQKFGAKGFNLDFLNYKPEEKYDKIIQNPPFSILGHAQIDIAFIYHAFNLLRVGGKLVSIVSESPFFRSNSKSVAFRDWLEEHDAEIESLDSGTFKESGTMVKTRIIKVTKK